MPKISSAASKCPAGVNSKKHQQECNLTNKNKNPVKNSRQITDTPPTDATGTLILTPDTSMEVYGDAFNFAFSKIFTNCKSDHQSLNLEGGTRQRANQQRRTL